MPIFLTHHRNRRVIVSNSTSWGTKNQNFRENGGKYNWGCGKGAGVRWVGSNEIFWAIQKKNCQIWRKLENDLTLWVLIHSYVFKVYKMLRNNLTRVVRVRTGLNSMFLGNLIMIVIWIATFCKENKLIRLLTYQQKLIESPTFLPVNGLWECSC